MNSRSSTQAIASGCWRNNPARCDTENTAHPVGAGLPAMRPSSLASALRPPSPASRLLHGWVSLQLAPALENRCITLAETRITRRPTQGPRPGVATALAASAANAGVLGPLGHPQVLAQPAHHLGQGRRRIVDTDITILQRLPGTIRLQQKRQQPGRIVGMNPIAV